MVPAVDTAFRAPSTQHLCDPAPRPLVRSARELEVKHTFPGEHAQEPVPLQGWSANHRISQFYVLFAFWMIIGKSHFLSLGIISLCLIVAGGAVAQPEADVLHF